jgi:hypothetical protein
MEASIQTTGRSWQDRYSYHREEGDNKVLRNVDSLTYIYVMPSTETETTMELRL